MADYDIPTVFGPQLVQTFTSASASAVGTSYDFSDQREALLFLALTTVAGTSPTLDVAVQTSPDASTWFTLAAVPQITATGNTLQTVANFGRHVRLSWAIGGTSPEWTGTAHWQGKT